ncbi:hypothetical protein FV232_27155 [Methylobacterium sp. WL30]|uniref:DUF5681 domain-containing protein n=1 Tax=unclassified Methylobacterium TaxID=2615210 RepID=UPI0011C96577|nr:MULTISPECIES: DUF5681 domain-containing protein [unclassified Methylobacterium]TXN40681.1 hypothetical protein FV225_05395 [Methylobacterium sp. WL93]TXN50005.1 hypothetical protein FV227_14080 [Methylobacterium sp. WL119]TXN61403.1 hypothetical protein FV232_27155 [Methylobacterium sp. WL30]
MAENITQFEKGQSGNPSGRPKGSRNRTSLAMEAILEGEGEALTRKAIEMALDGDGPALRLCMDRLMPARKDRPVTFELPAIESTADIPKATSALLHAVSSGDLTPSEAADVGKAIDAHVKAIEAHEFAERLAALEQASGGKR